LREHEWLDPGHQSLLSEGCCGSCLAVKDGITRAFNDAMRQITGQ
jgi:hypothetical protein